ncbi:ADP-ribosylglycohydrolase family protein [Vallitalea guaymasensis]|uniref:ADP-ribosylglycohydrolase family protein n=1 Tax=Vallitalea guaymasensis TaxID=1185412 RepID=A0A8J8MC66_9FIRM|nr:ADP-ribosylglycohydrolase family protein [Vallitalea guaymasensis]QUH30103.1 ADP-ribosylglycohydrolase family protein [Vallitalea guaymasensis]
MKAWEMEQQLIESAIPVVLSEEEQQWDGMADIGKVDDDKIKLLWGSNVPGSGAPERVIIAGIQAIENRGYIVEGYEEIIKEGLEALNNNDMVKLHTLTSKLYHQMNICIKDEKSSYWKYKIYKTWKQYEEDVTFVKDSYDVNSKDFEEKILIGWKSQLVGGALGTAVEGYTTDNLRKVFGEIRDYVRKPNTLNDDITFELAFLKAFMDKGGDVDSVDIAHEWIGLIPAGWSAEEVALRNIRYGIYPPESGTFCNPYCEWIGAQMRGAICGMVAPGNPKEAARLAWLDGQVSHYNNGIIGEIFNAMLVSLSFTRKDVRLLLKEVINMIPSKSEYYSVVKFALDQCEKSTNWEQAWRPCEEKYAKYNWIHAYPNAAAEVVALWFGNGDYDETLHIIAMEGVDVDCNAAQIMTALGIIVGKDKIADKWTEPFDNNIETYVRSMENIDINELTKWTVESCRNALKA